MRHKILGQTDLAISVVGLGCWAFAGGTTWGFQSDSDSMDTIAAARDCGINFFDTAEAYGDGYSETVLGKALKKSRADVIVASKFNAKSQQKSDVIEACERSLQRLQTDYIDLYQIHWPSRDVPFEETMDGLLTLKQQGKIRHIGVCNFGVKDLSDILKIADVVTNQLAYNLLWRAIEFEVIPFCREHKVDILSYSPLAQGLLSGRFRSADDVPIGRARTKHFSSERLHTRHGQPGAEALTFGTISVIEALAHQLGIPMSRLAISWLFHQTSITSVLSGARTPKQIQENVAAVDLVLDDETILKLDKGTAELKDKLGTNPDMWSDRMR